VSSIVIGGFSQGAAMSAITAYQYPHKLAGVCCLSGYLPFAGDYATVG
jgi:phospholipase/carboxylesterase